MTLSQLYQRPARVELSTDETILLSEPATRKWRPAHLSGLSWEALWPCGRMRHWGLEECASSVSGASTTLRNGVAWPRS